MVSSATMGVVKNNNRRYSAPDFVNNIRDRLVKLSSGQSNTSTSSIKNKCHANASILSKKKLTEKMPSNQVGEFDVPDSDPEDKNASTNTLMTNYHDGESVWSENCKLKKRSSNKAIDTASTISSKNSKRRSKKVGETASDKKFRVRVFDRPCVVEHGRSPPPSTERKITVSGSSVKRVPRDPGGTSSNDLPLATKHERNLRFGRRATEPIDINKHAAKNDVEDLKHGMMPFRKYNLGDVSRTPGDMIIHTSNNEAIHSASLLVNNDMAFLKRSNGLWTAAILADRSLQPKKTKQRAPAHWYSELEIDPATMELEDSMLFVINEDGATKIVARHHWGKFVRRMSL